MVESKIEIWKALPNVPGVEVSTFGRVRTLDKAVSSEKYTRFVKGHVLKQWGNSRGYLSVNVPINGKQAKKRVNRLVSQTFLPNPDSLPMVNHKDCNRANNNVENLEWCTASYNSKYREKFGKAKGLPLFAINLSTLKVSRFSSQGEASRALGIFRESINMVIKDRYKQTHGFWFVNADENAVDAIKNKLEEMKK